MVKVKSSGRHARNKGANAEREIFGILSEKLGFEVKRNLTQTRLDGGADSNDILGFSVEIKRQEKINIRQWWAQTVEQAGSKQPVLFYRESRKPWKCCVTIKFFLPITIQLNTSGMAIIEVDDFCRIYELLYVGPRK
jgi:hypothetical protein